MIFFPLVITWTKANFPPHQTNLIALASSSQDTTPRLKESSPSSPCVSITMMEEGNAGADPAPADPATAPMAFQTDADNDANDSANLLVDVIVVSDSSECRKNDDASDVRASASATATDSADSQPTGLTPGGIAASERRLSFSIAEGRTRSRSVGERQWSHVRAVMAWYTRLRRIKKSVTL